MTDPKDSWREVAGKAEALGLKLKLHLEQEHDETTPREPGDTKALVDDLGQRLQEAFDSMGNAAQDPAVHEDVKDMGRLMKDALLSTFNAVGAEVSARTGTSSTGTADEDGADDEEGGAGEA
ncbi:MAG: hypothetical protein HKO87_01235 [Acidimicrobiia bacterium]|nr:hypothetical protein [Acidimicrobiia bacterium]